MWFKAKLDNEASYEETGGIYESILLLPEQMRVGFLQVREMELPTNYCREIEKIVVVGMGGSALGARVVKAWGAKKMIVPMEIINDYHLPAYVDAKTLVILSSYSGNTEEVLSAAEETKERGAEVFVISRDGRLSEIAVARKWPKYVIDDQLNPSGQPRMGVGFAIMALLGLLVKLDFLRMDEGVVEAGIGFVEGQMRGMKKEVETAMNPAKKMAEKMVGKEVVLIGARHLSGVSHVMKNQINENAKNWAVKFDIPELNHHLLEGLGLPGEIKKNVLFVLMDSELYEERIAKRVALTEEVLQKQGYETVRLKPEAKEELAEVMEVLMFGSFLSFYLAIANGVKPNEIKWVDYFKQKMAV